MHNINETHSSSLYSLIYRYYVMKFGNFQFQIFLSQIQLSHVSDVAMAMCKSPYVIYPLLSVVLTVSIIDHWKMNYCFGHMACSFSSIFT